MHVIKVQILDALHAPNKLHSNPLHPESRRRRTHDQFPAVVAVRYVYLLTYLLSVMQGTRHTRKLESNTVGIPHC